MANFLDDMARSGFKGKRRTAVIVLLSFAVLILVFRDRSLLGTSEFSGSLNYQFLLDGERVVGFNFKESGKTLPVIIKDRVAYLQKQCSKKDAASKFRDPALNPPLELIVNEKYSLIYCNVPKVGCTNWKSVFLKIGGIDDIKIKALQRLPTNTRGRIYLDYFHKYKNVSRRQFMLRNFTKFVITRHPFTRILSAFRDKLAPNISYLFRNKQKQDVNWIEQYGIYIIKKYRGEKEAERVKSNWKNEYDLKFSEFVRYLIDTDVTNFDKHWKPINMMCRPCDVRYDIIGKYETMDEDADYILRLANISPDVKYPAPIKKSTTNSSSLEILRNYYKDVPREHLRKLYEVYRKDFELFDYSLDTFLKFI